MFSSPLMVFIKYITMYKVHMHSGEMRKLLYAFVYVREDNPQVLALPWIIFLYIRINHTITCLLSLTRRPHNKNPNIETSVV